MTIWTAKAQAQEMKTRRHHRVLELMRREIDDILRRSVKDPRLASFTITQVLLSIDMKSADIYVARFLEAETEPTEKQRKDLMAGLASASHFVYEQLKKRLQMKVIPALRFHYDLELANASRVWSIVGGLSEPKIQDGVRE